jgi:hypothetical protein
MDASKPTNEIVHVVQPSEAVEAPGADGPVADPTEVKAAWFWIKDTRGNGSVSTTLVTVAFLVTSIAYCLSIIDHIGPVTFRAFDAGATSAYFIPILTLYFGRHWVDANAKNPIVGG